MAASKSLTPAERALRARLAAHAQWATTEDRTARTAAAYAKSPLSFDYWRAKVEGERPDLSPAEVRRRAESLWKSNQARLALRSSQARRRRSAETADQ